VNNGPARKSLIDPERPLSSCGMPRLAGNRVQETPKYELVINLKPRGPIAAQTASVVRTAQLRSRCLSPTISKTRPSGPDIRSTRQLRPAASSRSARIDTVGHSRDRVAKHARCIGLRHGGHLEPAGHRMPERVEAEPITLQPGCLELVAEQFTKAGADLAAFGGAALQTPKQRPILRQARHVLQQAGRRGAESMRSFGRVGSIAGRLTFASVQRAMGIK
jgi:hypothetical protein